MPVVRILPNIGEALLADATNLIRSHFKAYFNLIIALVFSPSVAFKTKYLIF